MENNPLKQPIDEEKANLTRENEKINNYFNEKGISLDGYDKTPNGIPKIDSDKKEVEKKYTVDQIEEFYRKSMQKQKAKKFRTKVTASILAVSAVATLSCTAIFKAMDYHIKNKEYREAITYMNENYMENIFDTCGVTIEGIDEKGKPKYSYTPTTVSHVVSKVMDDFGFTKEQAILLVYKTLGTDSFSEEYFEHLGYKKGDELDQYLPTNQPSDVFERAEKEDLTAAIKRYKLIYEIDNGLYDIKSR